MAASLTVAFCLAISSMNEFAALLSASIRFVVSPSPIGSFIDPEASSTNTMSSGVVAVSDRFEVDDSAVSAVRKSAPFSLDMVTPFLLISPSDTVLSVQIRPTLDVSFSISPCQSQMVEGSVTAVLFPPYVVADESSANAAPPNSGDNASTSTAANAALKRFVDFMSSPPSTASRPSISPCACICARSGFSGTLTSSWARSFPHGPPHAMAPRRRRHFPANRRTRAQPETAHRTSGATSI